MHVVYLTSEYITEKRVGGLGVYLSNVAYIFKSKGHKVHVITLSDVNGVTSDRNGVEVVRVKRSDHKNNAIKYVIDSFRIRKALDGLASVEKIDIVQAANYHAVGLVRRHDIPTIVRVSSDGALLRNARKKQFDFDKAIRDKNFEDSLENISVRIADKAFAPSYFCAEVIGERTKKCIDVIESPYLEKLVDENPILFEKYLKNKQYIIYNNTINWLKGAGLLISATDELMKKYPELMIVYAGNDDCYEYCDGLTHAAFIARQNRLYGGRVKYLGRLNRARLFPLVRNSIACVIPSRVDNLPNSCIEAMSLKTVVIGTKGASFEQLITDGVSGFLIQRDSKESLIDAISRAISLSKEERNQITSNACEVLGRLTSDRIYSELFEYYNSAILYHETKR